MKRGKIGKFYLSIAILYLLDFFFHLTEIPFQSNILHEKFNF